MARPKEASSAREGLQVTLAPITAGLLLDALDLATFGPVGLWAGFFVGAAAGWLLAPSVGLFHEKRWWCAGLAGIYCMLPFTAFLPLATLLGVVSKLRASPKGEREPDAAERPAIEPDYHAHWDE